MFTVRNNFDVRALTPVTIPVSDIYDVGAAHNGDDAPLPLGAHQFPLAASFRI